MSATKDTVPHRRVVVQRPAEPPYLYRVVLERRYNPNYGNDRLCQCGHPYYRHFDWMDDSQLCGCKYCGCFEFKPLDTAAA